MRPIAAAPAGLSAALLRAGPLDADASEGLRTRHALLLAAARVVPVPAAASPRGRQAEAGQGQEQEVLLSGVGWSISHALVPPGLDPPPPLLLASGGCFLLACGGIRPWGGRMPQFLVPF